MGVPVPPKPMHLIGTPGPDTLEGDAVNDRLEGVGGDDTLFGFGGEDNLIGGRGDDVLRGGSGTDVLGGELGDDVLDGGSGGDVMEGGPGDDKYFVDAPGDEVIELTNDGIDSVFANIDFTLPDNVEHLILSGILSGLRGFGNELDNRIVGDTGKQLLSGRGGDDTLSGKSGNDVLSGGGGDDSLSGGNGTDRLDGGTGSNRLAGGAGNDTYVVRTLGDVVIETGGAGTDKVLAAVSYRLPDHVERLVLTGKAAINGTGNDLDNVMRGNDASNLLRGAAGDDTVDGGAGNDSLSGGGGDDTLKGGGGQDRVAGGGGDDLFFVNASNDKVIEAPGEGVDTVRSSATFVLKANVEDLTLTGKTAIDGTGNGLGNAITGNGASNVLAGRGGDDVLQGRDNDDSLIGGGGLDTMTGGSGLDRFVYLLTSDGAGIDTDVVRGAVSADLVTDFTPGADVFQFASAFDVGGALTDGSPIEGTSFSVIADAYDGTNHGANTNHGADLGSFVFSTADDTLYFDDDGTGPGYVVIATLDNGALLAATDIVLV